MCDGKAAKKGRRDSVAHVQEASSVCGRIGDVQGSHYERIRSLTAAGDVEDKRSEMCGPSAPIPGPFWDRDVRSPASAQAPEVAQIELLGMDSSLGGTPCPRD